MVAASYMLVAPGGFFVAPVGIFVATGVSWWQLLELPWWLLK